MGFITATTLNSLATGVTRKCRTQHCRCQELQPRSGDHEFRTPAICRAGAVELTDSVARLAGRKDKDGPHILRHTAATWMMRSGVDAFEASGFLGMSPEVLWDVYGHHHPKFQQSAAAATGKRKPVRAERAEHLPSNLPSDVLIDSVSR